AGLVGKMEQAKGGKSQRIQPALETQPRVIKKELTSGSRRQNKVESLNGKAPLPDDVLAKRSPAPRASVRQSAAWNNQKDPPRKPRKRSRRLGAAWWVSTRNHSAVIRRCSPFFRSTRSSRRRFNVISPTLTT